MVEEKIKLGGVGMIVAEVAASAVECVIMAEFLTRFMGLKNERYKVAKISICFLLLFADGIICPLLTDIEIVPIFIILAVEVTYSVVFLKGSIYKKVFVVFISCVAMLLINTTVLMLLEKILSSNMEDLISGNGTARLMVLFLTKFLYFLLTRFLLKLNGSGEYDLGKSEWIMLLSIFAVTFLVGTAVLECTVNGMNTEIFMVTSVLGLILINIISYILMLRMNKENIERTKAMLLEIQIKENTESIHEIHRMYEEICRIRHDTKHWITGSLALIRQKNYAEAEKYLENLVSEKIGTIRDYVMTESEVINAIINSKLSKASQMGIDMRANVGTEVGETDVYGLSVALANLLDNAIEGCMRIQGKRKIYFEMFVDGEYLKVFVKNTYDGSGINLETQKTNKQLHGLGHKSVDDYAKRNDGFVNFYEENDEFCANMWIMVNKKRLFAP